jgi:hypothetical protein
MDTDLRASGTIVETHPAVSWAAVAAGAVATAAFTLLLVALGAGLGLSAVSPWSDSGVSASTFSVGTGIYLVVVAVMASAIGGYLAGRLRTQWTGVHTNEVFFRDTAHGLLAWAFATLISAVALSSTTAYLANGALTGGLAGASSQASHVTPADIYIDKLFRAPPAGASGAMTPDANNAGATPSAALPTSPPASSGQSRAEVLRLWNSDFRNGAGLDAADRTYVAQLVAARTGLSQADAEKRVDAVVIEAKTALDNTRLAAAHLSFWLTAAMLFGAFAASLAAAEGGALRDGTWNGRVLTPRQI